MDCVNCVYVLHKMSGLGILRSSRAATVKKCTKKIAVNILLFRRSSCCRLSLLRSPVFCSLDPIQSTLFEHGEWLSKLVFRHAV